MLRTKLLGIAALVSALVAAVAVIVVLSNRDDGPARADESDPSGTGGPATDTTDPARPDPGPANPPRGRPVFDDRFDEDPALRWIAHEAGAGSISWRQGTVTLDVPAAGQPNAAFLTRHLDAPRGGLVISGTVRIGRAGCDRAAPPTHGNVPLVRVHDPSGVRRFALLRENGACGRTERVLVQTSGQYDDTEERVTLGDRSAFTVVLRSGAAGRGRVSVWFGDERVFHTPYADLGAGGFSRITLGNDTPGQVGRLSYTRLRVASVPAAPAAPRCSADPAVRGVEQAGGVLVADGFSSLRPRWVAVRHDGGTAYLHRLGGRGARCALRVLSDGQPGAEVGVTAAWPPTTAVTVTARVRVSATGDPEQNAPLLTLGAKDFEPIAEVLRSNEDGTLWVKVTDAAGEEHFLASDVVLDGSSWIDLEVSYDAATRTVRLVAEGDEVLAESGVVVRPDLPASLHLASWHPEAYTVDVDHVVVREGAS